MGYILAEVTKLHRYTQSTDPVRVAAAKNIEIQYIPLGNNIWGFCTTIRRIPVICVNNAIGDFETRFTISHELGHLILHPGINTPFLRLKTLFSIDRIEREANCFAVRFLAGSEPPEKGETMTSYLKRCGIPEEYHDFY